MSKAGKFIEDHTRKGSNVEYTQGVYTPSIEFKDFWKVYPIRRNKIRAERAWDRLSEADKRKAYEGVAGYQQQCIRSRVSMMYPQGYLNNRRWEDEDDDGLENGPCRTTAVENIKGW